MTVFVDWGTTNLRAWRVDDTGKMISKNTLPMGLLAATKAGFSQTLEQALYQLGARPDSLVLLSGMIGSKNGWQETPYARLPADPKAIAGGIEKLTDRANTWVVGGVCSDQRLEFPEVIRGEKVQALGVLKSHEAAAMICMPGTHSKWIMTNSDTILAISTYMTGEMFDLFTQHSIISTQIASRIFRRQAFERGLAMAEKSTRFTNALFQLRTRYLFQEVSADEVHSFASGFLIGYEIKCISNNDQPPELVHLCSSKALSSLYELALSHFAIPYFVVDAERATLDGFTVLLPFIPTI